MSDTSLTGTDFDTSRSDAIEDLSGSYAVDPSHTRLGFQARHAMITNVRGHFSEFTGTVVIDATDPTASTASTVELQIQMASVSTGSADRDNHLRSGDFFDVEQFPTMDFRSTSVEVVDVADQTLRVHGDLTIKGIAKPVTVELEFTGSARDPFGNNRAGFEGRAQVNRKDWGLTWNAALETGGVLVSEKIKLAFDVSLVKA